MESHNIFTFHTISQALKLERVLKKNKIFVKLRPVPRKISSSCGNCAYVKEEDMKLINSIIEKEKIEYDSIYNERDL